jgi:hypothetical protein
VAYLRDSVGGYLEMGRRSIERRMACFSRKIGSLEENLGGIFERNAAT